LAANPTDCAANQFANTIAPTATLLVPPWLTPISQQYYDDLAATALIWPRPNDCAATFRHRHRYFRQFNLFTIDLSNSVNLTAGAA